MSQANLIDQNNHQNAQVVEQSLGKDQSSYRHPSEEHIPVHQSDLPIHKAAYKGDLPLLISLIASCENIDVLNYYDCSPLHLAVRGDHAECVRLLLEAGADPALEDNIDSALQPPFNAINLAAWIGAQHAMDALIEAGIPLSSSVLERSASLNFVGCVQTILKKLGERNFSDVSRLEAIRSALIRAACCWHLEAVDLLLTRVSGFPDRNVPEDRAALGLALCSAVDLEYICIEDCRWISTAKPGRLYIIMEKLVASGADVNAEIPQARHRSTAFWTATGDENITRFLLDNGLRQDSETKDGQTPLFGIVSNPDIKIDLLEAFINAGANVTHRDKLLRTPLHYAANQAVAEILHKHGADLFAKDESGMTPLHMSCKGRFLDVAQFLVSKGANVHEPTVNGRTPLLCVVCVEEDDSSGSYIPPTDNSRTEVAQFLLAHGAYIHAATMSGQIVLHCAAHLGDAELTRYFVEHGANVLSVDSNGDTALHNAARIASLEIVNFVVEQGANVHAVNADGETAIHAACSRVNASTLPTVCQIAEILVDNGVELNGMDAAGNTPLLLLYEQCYRYQPYNTDTFNSLLRRGADKNMANSEGTTVKELIERDDKWTWDEAGLLQTRRRPFVTSSRGGRGRSRGRGAVRGG